MFSHLALYIQNFWREKIHLRSFGKRLLILYWQKSIGIIYQMYRKKTNANKLSRKIISITESTKDNCILKIINDQREIFRKAFKEFYLQAQSQSSTKQQAQSKLESKSQSSNYNNYNNFDNININHIDNSNLQKSKNSKKLFGKINKIEKIENFKNIQKPYCRILPDIKEMQAIILEAAKIHPPQKKNNSPSK